MENLKNCFICEEALSDGQTTEVKQRGITTLSASSLKRRDGKAAQLAGLQSVTVHVKCQKHYTHDKNIAVAIKAKLENVTPPTSSRRSSIDNSFDFKSKCLFCAEDATTDFLKRQAKKAPGKRDSVHVVMTLPVKDNILNAADDRTDQWGVEVSLRIRNVIDLVAAEARYHGSCRRKFFQPPTDRKRGREEDQDVKVAVEYICDYIKANREECQFSLNDILREYKGYIPPHRTIQNKLENKYGNDIIITTVQGKESIICFRDTGYKILTSNWYKNRKIDTNEERLRIVKAAAAIITEDIRSRVYETKYYPPPDAFLKNVDSDVPETLNVLLEAIICKNKRGKEDKWITKCTAIAHAIIAAARPRSFLSSLQIGLGAFLGRKYGSKDLLHVLSALGFCCTYQEATLFEVSAIMHPQKTVMTNSFSQFVFDNADVNINTIDGLNTFHSMGGIQCVTPGAAVSSDEEIPRLPRIPRADNIGDFGRVPLRTYQRTGKSGLAAIQIYDLNDKNSISGQIKLLPSDFLWVYGKSKNTLDVPGWNAYMERLRSHETYSKSRILCLPFVNAPPSDYDTIYTALLIAAEKCKSLGQSSCFVTFDQPLYIKARDIVSSAGENSELGTVIVRLGGFHLLMSFMGSIGYIMDGSGLKDLFSVVYAASSTDKMLDGHAYARAVRAHTLVHLALAKIVLSTLNLSDEEHTSLGDALFEVGDPSLLAKLEEEPFRDIVRKFNEKLNELEQNGPTAKLWVQYFHMVTLMKQFIQAERSGDWHLHLECIQKMLPYFHASGHFLYAKSAQLYLQDMFDLKLKLTSLEYEKFVTEACFTIRRSEKFWSGIWSDMTIEQKLMRLLKSTGGLTHGRGITDSVLAKWILAMPVLLDISQAIEDFCRVVFATTEQHVDARASRISRDEVDIKKLADWLSSHYPFLATENLMSISTGVQGDEKINCHKAYEIGKSSMAAIIGKSFNDVKFQRRMRVTPLRAVNCAIKIHDEVIPINPLLLFQRISLTLTSKEELKLYFRFELAPYPLSIFVDGVLRRTNKSSFYELFTPISITINFGNHVHVVDGGFLLHRVVWHQHETFASILSKYVEYVTKYYKANSVIVFDGYPEDAAEKSTKSAERLRRVQKHAAVNVNFDESMSVTMPQDKFLSNDNNKNRLISLLREKLQSAGFLVKQASEDADSLIVNSAIDISPNYDSVIIVGEDVDLLILLMGLAGSHSNVYFMKPSKGRTDQRIYSCKSFNYSKEVADHILFLHAISGCDTTSAFFRQGKVKFVKLLEKSQSLQKTAEIFKDPNAHPDSIDLAGQKFITALYGAKSDENSLDEFRYQCFAKAVSKSTFNLASLPPTESAARQHSFRAYYQIQQWYGNCRTAQDWGWKKTKFGLLPIPTTKEAAPQDLLKTISCKCTKGCKAACGCRKAGLRCSVICYECQGHSCTNVEAHLQLDDSDEDDIDRTMNIAERNKNLTETDDLVDDDRDIYNIEVSEISRPPTSKKAKTT